MPPLKKPWEIGPDDPEWQSLGVTKKILGKDKEGKGKPIPITWARACATRVRNMRAELCGTYEGLDDVVYWLLATLIARENALLLGPPGVAKSELAVRCFKLLGLEAPKPPDTLPRHVDGAESLQAIRENWLERDEMERENPKYFHYLLSRFTQVEELFGPIEISLLRQGVLVRVNQGLLTGPGVRAAFLDEIFKASSSILNTLLTLTQERQYFSWGGMVDSDLHILLGASNELPGGFGTGIYGAGSGTDDFQSLYAFLDRFPVRLLVPNMSGTSDPSPEASQLARASRKAIGRAGAEFGTGEGFSSPAAKMPGINDLLLLGRCCLEQEAGLDHCLFRREDLDKFWKAFITMATALQQRGTAMRPGVITWTISPRKVKALYKIALAHALVCDDRFSGKSEVVCGPGGAELRVFEFIWDSPGAQSDLSNQVQAGTQPYYR
ncbi:MAG: AAA family ATPase [Anaerolineae bacterium]|nr:AAA family ATPase [Anaerolineae bacterium]